MKTNHLQKMLAVLAVAGLAWSASTTLAQDSSAANTVQPAAVNAPVAQLSYGAAQIVQLAQAKVGDDTIITYIKNSGNSYGLTVNQIIYLRQQGISDAVITTMLNQPKPVVAAAPVATPASTSTAEAAPLYSPRQREQILAASTSTSTAETSTATIAPTGTYVQTVTGSGSTITTASGSTATVAPTVTYVQTAPAPTYYYQPYYYQPYYYPAYAWYPPVSFSFGWGWGGGWHGGGWHGGWHR
jgi:hypothetical protein